MATYITLINFTDQGISKIKDTANRASHYKELATKLGCTVKENYWTQGQYDVVSIVDAPDEASMTALAMSVGKLGYPLLQQVSHTRFNVWGATDAVQGSGVFTCVSGLTICVSHRDASGDFLGEYLTTCDGERLCRIDWRRFWAIGRRAGRDLDGVRHGSIIAGLRCQAKRRFAAAA
jgi:uncharacterized protein with GYD domain